MQNVLADLAIESEAATATALRLARAYDGRTRDEAERHFARFAIPLVKYWICKRTPPLVAEALECLGGNGYVEECVLPRLYREAPVNSVWEGSGNVMCLDVLRALTRERESVDAFFDELGLARGLDPRLDTFVASVRDELTRPEEVEAGARRIVERLALALEASLLVRGGHPALADAFVRRDSPAIMASRSAPCPRAAISRRSWTAPVPRCSPAPRQEGRTGAPVSFLEAFTPGR